MSVKRQVEAYLSKLITITTKPTSNKPTSATVKPTCTDEAQRKVDTTQSSTSTASTQPPTTSTCPNTQLKNEEKLESSSSLTLSLSSSEPDLVESAAVRNSDQPVS